MFEATDITHASLHRLMITMHAKIADYISRNNVSGTDGRH